MNLAKMKNSLYTATKKSTQGFLQSGTLKAKFITLQIFTEYQWYMN